MSRGTSGQLRMSLVVIRSKRRLKLGLGMDYHGHDQQSCDTADTLRCCRCLEAFPGTPPLRCPSR